MSNAKDKKFPLAYREDKLTRAIDEIKFYTENAHELERYSYVGVRQEHVEILFSEAQHASKNIMGIKDMQQRDSQ